MVAIIIYWVFTICQVLSLVLHYIFAFGPQTILWDRRYYYFTNEDIRTEVKWLSSGYKASGR